jgi:hypothetical protein
MNESKNNKNKLKETLRRRRKKEPNLSIFIVKIKKKALPL